MSEKPRIKEVMKPELPEKPPPAPPEYDLISVSRPAEEPSIPERALPPPLAMQQPLAPMPVPYRTVSKPRQATTALLVIALVILAAGNVATGYLAFQSKSSLDELAKRSTKLNSFTNFFQDTRIQLQQLLYTAGTMWQEQKIRITFARPEDFGLSRSDRITVTYEILNVTLSDSARVMVPRSELDIFRQTRFEVPNATSGFAYPEGDYAIRISGEFQGFKLNMAKAWVVRPDRNPPRIILVMASLRSVVAKVFDQETSVGQVLLFFAPIDALVGRRPWNRNEMRPIDKDTYATSFPEGTSAPILFFIEATDLAGNVQRTEPQVILSSGPDNGYGVYYSSAVLWRLTRDGTRSSASFLYEFSPTFGAGNTRWKLQWLTFRQTVL